MGWGCYPHYEKLMPKMKLFCCGMLPEPTKRTFVIYLPTPPPPPQYFIARFQLVSFSFSKFSVGGGEGGVDNVNSKFSHCCCEY